MSTSQKIAVVTGAGTGVGKAAAQALADNGFTVVMTGRRKDKLEETLRECGGKGLVAPADITDPASVAALFKTVTDTYGRLDVLFNNAGAGVPAVPMDELPFEHWKMVVDTNLTGVFLCTQAAFGIMKKQTPRGGRIINNGSISAHTPRPMAVAYTASKHGVTGLTRQTALDGRPFDICCGQIDIGNAATPMTARMIDGVLQPDGRMMPEPRMDTVHVGNAVAYMANLPLDTNVLFMTVMSNQMPFYGRG
jgi:NAD(P)-dependent dehydrogenase (short-subunit alcohol dehydrogenase family)